MLPCLHRSVLLALLLLATPVRAEAPLCGRPYDPAERVARRVHGAATPPAFARPTTQAEPIGAVRRVHVTDGRKLIALTFDLCETEGEIAGYDGGVVGVLRREGVAATFFSGGHWAATHKARIGELLADSLFEVGNHTWSHANLRTVSAERRALEIGAAQATLNAAAAAPVCSGATPKQPAALFRFPFGACDQTSLSAVRGAGLVPVQWDVSSGDPSPGQSAAAIVHTVLNQVRPGSIVLMHANGRGWHTAEALPALIAGLRARGYTPVTVSDLLAAGTPEITSTCYDAHPGDTDRYDRWPRVLSSTPDRPKAIPVRLP
jgi:peptidoglycan/xylan/chitin deacetylase (PgdA/CDA1 family)